MKPYNHARNSVRKWKGVEDDYMPIHEFIDSSKAHYADMRHRALLHTSFGCYLAELVFGTMITNSSGIKVSVRDVAEQHIIEDMGRIPSVSHFLDNMTLQNWMGGPSDRTKKVKRIKL